MTNKELMAIGRRVLVDLPGFSVAGQLLVLEPLLHTVRGIFFDRSINPRAFYAEVLLQPLYVPSEHFVFNIGWRLGGGCHTWCADDPEMALELIQAIRDEALPFLSQVNTPNDVVNATRSLNRPADTVGQRAIAYSLILSGEVREAGAIIDQLVSGLDPTILWQRELAETAGSMKRLSEVDHSEAKRQLEAFIPVTTRSLKLERFSTFKPTAL